MNFIVCVSFHNPGRHFFVYLATNEYTLIRIPIGSNTLDKVHFPIEMIFLMTMFIIAHS